MFMKEIQENYNRNCTYDQYGYLDESNEYRNTFPSMFRINMETYHVSHQPIMDVDMEVLDSYESWIKNLISIDNFVRNKKSKYTVTVELVKKTIMLADVTVYAKNEHMAKLVSMVEYEKIKEDDMRESEDSSISVNSNYVDWNIEKEGE